MEVNVAETMKKSSIKFEWDLNPEERPSIFTHSFVTDPDNFAYFKLIQKRRKNKVDTDHCSRLLMERALNNDVLYSAKVGLKINRPYDFDFLWNNLSF